MFHRFLNHILCDCCLCFSLGTFPTQVVLCHIKSQMRRRVHRLCKKHLWDLWAVQLCIVVRRCINLSFLACQSHYKTENYCVTQGLLLPLFWSKTDRTQTQTYSKLFISENGMLMSWTKLRFVDITYMHLVEWNKISKLLQDNVSTVVTIWKLTNEYLF